MERKPRNSKEAFLPMVLADELFSGIVLAVLSLGVFHYGLTHFGVDVGRTMVLQCWGYPTDPCSHVRSESKSVF